MSLDRRPNSYLSQQDDTRIGGETNGDSGSESLGPDGRPFFESGKFHSLDYIVQHTIVPEDPSQIPDFVGLVGPARGGTTAFGLIMASQSPVDRSHFQPWKKILRHGEEYGPFKLNAGEGIVVAKDTFGPLADPENFDPIDMLTRAGVPEEKQTWVLTLREPIACYASILHFTPMDPSFFAKMQAHTIDLYERYKNTGRNVIPFSYDLFGHEAGELEVMKALMRRTGIPKLNNGLTLEFDEERINQRMDLGEANDPVYYEQVITPILSRGRFAYVGGTVNYTDLKITDQEARVLEERCIPAFQQFAATAASEIGLM